MLAIFRLSSCTTPLVLKNMSAEEDGYFMFGKIPERNFYESITIDEVIPAWEGETSGSQSYTSPIFYNKTLFLSDLSGRIYGFDRLTGAKIGYEKYGGAVSVTPILNKLRLFFVVNEKLENYSLLIMYDFISGKILSEVKIDGNVTNELLKLNDGIVVLTNRGELIKFNFVGVREWSYKTKTTSLSSPAANNALILFGNQKGELISVDVKTGKLISNMKLKNPISGGITIDKSSAYLGDEKGLLYSVNFENQSINWVYDSGAKIISTPVFDNDKIYFGNLNGDLTAITKNNGKKFWSFNFGGVFNATPLLTKNILVQPDLNKKVLFVNVSNGKIVKTLTFDRRAKLSPVYYDGMLYLGSDRGIINAYKIYGDM